jgi:hypothetical protein
MGGGVLTGPRSCCGVLPAQNAFHKTVQFRGTEPSRCLLPCLYETLFTHTQRAQTIPIAPVSSGRLHEISAAARLLQYI